jgi:hypothetical protein
MENVNNLTQPAEPKAVFTLKEALAEYQAELLPGTYLEINEGWLPLFCAAASVVRYYNKQCKLEGDQRITINTVKEKFGSLRIYLSMGEAPGHAAEKVYSEVDGICAVSNFMCEFCGKAGALCSHNGWLKTSCHEHSPKAS